MAARAGPRAQDEEDSQIRPGRQKLTGSGGADAARRIEQRRQNFRRALASAGASFPRVLGRADRSPGGCANCGSRRARNDRACARAHGRARAGVRGASRPKRNGGHCCDCYHEYLLQALTSGVTLRMRLLRSAIRFASAAVGDRRGPKKTSAPVRNRHNTGTEASRLRPNPLYSSSRMTRLTSNPRLRSHIPPTRARRR